MDLDINGRFVFFDKVDQGNGTITRLRFPLPEPKENRKDSYLRELLPLLKAFAEHYEPQAPQGIEAREQ